MPAAEQAVAPSTRRPEPGPPGRTLGAVLVARRAELGLSRRQLAERAGLSYPFVSELERDTKSPSAASLAALARALELTPAQLLARTEVPAPVPGTDRPGTDRVGEDRSTSGVAGDASPDHRGELGGVVDLTALVRQVVRDELAAAPAPVEPLTVADLRERTAEALQVAFGDEVEVEIDDEGDIPLRFGEVMVFVRALGDPMSVLVFAPVLVDVDATAALDDRLNEINAGVRFVRFCWVRRSVVADLELFAEPFVPEHLVPACHAVGRAAEEFLGELRVTFGGEPFLQEPGQGPPPVAPRGTGGYL